MPATRTRRQLLQGATMLAAGAIAWRLSPLAARAAALGEPAVGDGQVHHTDAEWQKLLTPAQYDVLRQAGTETPFTSPLNHFYHKGRYTCAGCALPVFASETKFDSGTGWPSFWKPLPDAVVERQDGSLGMERTEIHCTRCESHLGHVFNDGPAPTGLRYCMNGVALHFTPAPGAEPAPQGA